MIITPMLMVHDVEASSAWLRSVLPLKSAHGGPEFEILANLDGTAIAWLHPIDSDHDHGAPQNLDPHNMAGGAVLYLQVSDEAEIQATFEKAKNARASIMEPPHVTAAAQFIEFSFKDPNGYHFAVHTGFGSAPPSEPESK